MLATGDALNATSHGSFTVHVVVRIGGTRAEVPEVYRDTSPLHS